MDADEHRCCEPGVCSLLIPLLSMNFLLQRFLVCSHLCLSGFIRG